MCGTRLDALTGEKQYLDNAPALYDWTKKTLQDPAEGHTRTADGHFDERWKLLQDRTPKLDKLMWDASDARLFFRVAAAIQKTAGDPARAPGS